MDNEWKPIETAPKSGVFLVRGGYIEDEYGPHCTYGSKYVEPEDGKLVCCLPYDYDIKEWIVGATEWKPI